jgi:hypothetical protein
MNFPTPGCASCCHLTEGRCGLFHADLPQAKICLAWTPRLPSQPAPVAPAAPALAPGPSPTPTDQAPPPPPEPPCPIAAMVKAQPFSLCTWLRGALGIRRLGVSGLLPVKLCRPDQHENT